MTSDREYNSRMRLRNREYVLECKSGRACEDCERSYPHYVMDFHHRDPAEKISKVNLMMNTFYGGIQRLIEEIDKCDLLCANCHRIREHSKQGGK